MTCFELKLVAGMACVTFLCRYPMLALVTRINLPPVVLAALQFVPIAVLTAIIVPAILAPAGALALSLQNSYLVAAVVAVLVARRRQSLLLTIAAGMGTWWFWQFFWR